MIKSMMQQLRHMAQHIQDTVEHSSTDDVMFIYIPLLSLFMGCVAFIMNLAILSLQ